MNEKLTFDDLAQQYDHLESRTQMENGRRVTRFISYVHTRRGNVERSQWQSMVRELIREAGEEELFQQLLEWTGERTLWLKTEKERENYALELHASRIFDKEEWVDFVPFNRKYRPGRLTSAGLVPVEADCCGKEFITTFAQIQNGIGTVCCPYCGRFSNYKMKGNENKNGCGKEKG